MFKVRDRFTGQKYLVIDTRNSGEGDSPTKVELLMYIHESHVWKWLNADGFEPCDY